MAPAKKRDAKRGDKPTTLASKGPQKVSFVDEQPPDRYNLVFYADYSDKDEVIERRDEGFLRLYHDQFPAALESKSVWATKAPGSRAHCRADLIKRVGSLRQIAFEMRQFIIDHSTAVKRFGTIILSGHGNPEEFALPLPKPVGDGGKRMRLPLLEIGLRHADSLRDEPPSEWPSTAEFWKQCKSDFFLLQVETDMLHKHLSQAWSDNQTLLRVWCCNLGKDPPSGKKDSLEILGKLFMGITNFMIEAPRHKSGNGHVRYTFPPSPSADLKAQLYRAEKKKARLWHPDLVSEVESDNSRVKHEGADLKTAQAEFVDLALQDSPGPRNEKSQWIPYFFVDDAAGNGVFPQNWAKFSKIWRRVVV